jgi:hypothetical protein
MIERTARVSRVRSSSGPCAGLAALCLVAAPGIAAEPTRPAPPVAQKQVLVLSADAITSRGTSIFVRSLTETLGHLYPHGARIDLESLDLVYFDSPDYYADLVELLHIKFAERQPEIVVAVGVGALRFAIAERELLFPDAKIAFCHIGRDDPTVRTPPPGSRVS